VLTVEVRSRVPGGTGPALPAVLLDLESERTTVAELIRRAVAEQIRELRADAARCRQILDRQYLSDADIRAGAASGVVRYPDGEVAVPDADEEAARAQRAFTAGVFAVFVGGRQVTDLDGPVVLRLGEPVVFLRLTPLVGG
jgi:hypothetical protein